MFISAVPEKGKKCTPKGVCKDIEWWYLLMEKFDGTAIMADDKFTNQGCILSSDACLTACNR